MKRKLTFKSLLLVAAMLLGGVNSAWAQTTTVGKTDNTSNYFTAFSDYYTLSENQKLYIDFTNHSGKAESYHNWVLFVTNDVNRGGSGYDEYTSLRADWWDNLKVERPDIYIKNYDWASFKNYMDGANVKMTVTRENGYVSIYALMSKTVDEEVKTWSESYTFKLPDDMASSNIRAFLTVDHSYISDISSSISSTGADYYTVGTTDKNALFFSTFSDYYTIRPYTTTTLRFKNYQGTYDWASWVLSMTNNQKRISATYAEKFVLVGGNANYWGASRENNKVTITQSDNFSTDIVSKMDGANVTLTISRTTTTVTARAEMSKEGYDDWWIQAELTLDNESDEVGAFLTADHSYFEVNEVTTTIGATDNTTEVYKAYSPYYALADNEKLSLEFTNSTDMAEFFHNWYIYITNDKDRDVTGYDVYAGMNAANNSWDDFGDAANRWIREEDYDANKIYWDNFKAYMDGANVKLTVSRENGRVNVLAHMTKNGKTWTESLFFDLPASASEKNIRVWLTVEKAHIVIDDSKTAITSTKEGYYTVGRPDKSSIFFSAQSDYYTIPAKSSLKVHFKNYGSTSVVYHNWCAYITNTIKRNTEGYTEYLALRSDAYGWGSKYSYSSISGTSVNDDNKAYMDGADVYTTITNTGSAINLKNEYTGTNGTTYTQTYSFDLDNETVNFFLVVDNAYLEVEDALYVNLDEETGYYGAWDGEKANVTLTRGITADKWSTICLPFAMTAEQVKSAFGENVKVAEIASGDASAINFESVDAIEANQPYAIKVDKAFASAEINGVTLNDNATPSATAGSWKFVGTYAPTNIPAEAYFFSDNQLWKAADGTNTTKAFRGYFTGVSSAHKLDFTVDGETLGIGNVYMSGERVNGEYYNLAGQRVNQPTKGLYVVNGKKVIVK